MAGRKVYQEQLDKLQDELTEMGNLCARAVQLAVQAGTTGDRELAERTVKTDEAIDQKEKDIESLCLRLLLTQQPVASDLRRISSALKMISDLERIGDQSADIAELSEYIVIKSGSAADDLRIMAGQVIKMVSESINAFVRNDLALSQQIIAWDDEADECFSRIKKDLIKAISEDNTQGEYCLDILMAAKYLERIGDHAVKVAEWVEYSILGYHPGTQSEES